VVRISIRQTLKFEMIIVLVEVLSNSMIYKSATQKHCGLEIQVKEVSGYIFIASVTYKSTLQGTVEA
jgi:hypothetical protein